MPGSTCAISDDTPNLQFLVCGFVLAGAKKIPYSYAQIS